jgi:hypothetical protein
LLAYVFWHVPRPGSAAREYEAAHAAFHETLWQSRPVGLLGVRVFRLVSIPWFNGQSGYEDWHLLEDSTALDVLNDAAISGARTTPHDRIATLAAEGTAGLYGVRSGRFIEPAIAHWLSKPAGMSYEDFDASLQPLVEVGCCLWGRRMTLGPTPEFCLHAPATAPLPYPAAELKLALTLSHGLR